MPLFGLVILLAIVLIALNALFKARGPGESTAPGPIAPGSPLSDDDDDWITDPAYSFLPSNIYYHRHDDDHTSQLEHPSGSDDPLSGAQSCSQWGDHRSHSSECDDHRSSRGDDCDSGDWSSGHFSSTDWITDPAYSFIPGNIFHNDHFSSFDDVSRHDDWHHDSSSSWDS